MKFKLTKTVSATAALLALFSYKLGLAATDENDAAPSADYELKVSDLGNYGVDPALVTEAFKNIHGRILDLDSVVKVSPNEEGDSLNVEALDHLSVVVHHTAAIGVFNKVN